METELLDLNLLDIPSLIRGRPVVLCGRLMSISHEQFRELLEAGGGKYSFQVARGTAVVVVGQRDWPVTDEGLLPPQLRTARKLIRHERSHIRIISEEQFLWAVGFDSYQRNTERLHTLSTLTQLLNVSRDRIRTWVAADLIRPSKIEYGVWYFDFRQVSAVNTLYGLLKSGVPLRRIRLSLEQLRRWLPEAAEPLEQLAVLENKEQILLRMEQGELIEPDGQLHFDFRGEDGSSSLRIVPGPRTAADWYEQGVEQECQGLLSEAAESYRQSLLLGGPDVQTCFDLANTLAAQGKKAQAVERYLQTVELDPNYADAWINLGIELSDLGRPADACSAFEKALRINPHDARARYNLADTLDEMGRFAEAAEHWQAYLKQDARGQRAEYARQRLSAAG